MTLRVLHTSDWHLGHTLHDIPREYEHECFFDWLLDTLQSERADALVIAGDIFDAANPSATAQQQWYRFLSRARSRHEKLDILAIAGNHDSAARLEAPRALLETHGVRVIGRLPRTEQGDLDLDRLLVPLHDAKGEVAAWCVAVPFLRPADLPRCPDAADELVEGVRRVYAEAIAGAVARRDDGQAILATGHCYMKTAAVTDLSERKILGGNEHPLPADIFTEEVAYAALGHLHRAHKVAGRREVRYCGSPIPLSMDQLDYPHQVCMASFEGSQLVDVEWPRIPRAIELLRVPKSGSKEKSEVLAQLRELPELDDEHHPPYLEVRIRLKQPESALLREVTEALQGKHARLVKLTPEYTGTGESLGEALASKQLQDLDAEDVFRQLYRSQHEGDPADDLMSCFREMVEAAQHGEGE